MEELFFKEEDLKNLISTIIKKVKDESVNFDDYINLSSALNRELYLGDIGPGVGNIIENYIRFWNCQDDLKNIPYHDRKPIKIYIDSRGGILEETFTIIDAISMSKTPVITINIGKAYSGGFFVFMSGHNRIAYKSSSFMFHEGSCGNAGDAGKFRNFASFYDKQLAYIKKLVLYYTKITEEEYERHIKDDWWLFAEEALELGICDSISKEFI